MRFLVLGDFNSQEVISLSQELVDVIKGIDFTVLNLEGYISKRCDTVKTLCIPEFVAKRNLKMLKVKYVSLANNHIFDGGVEGYEQTVRILNDLNITPFGTKSRSFVEFGNILLYSFAWNMTGVPKKARKYINVLNTREILNLSLELSNEKAILYPHWGVDFEKYPQPWQVYFAKNFLGKYDGIILGHHSHIIQPAIFEEEKAAIFCMGNTFMPYNDVTYYYSKDAYEGLGVILSNGNIESIFKTAYDPVNLELKYNGEWIRPQFDFNDDYENFFRENRVKRFYPLFKGDFLDNLRGSYVNLIGFTLNSKVGRFLWKKVRPMVRGVG